MQYLIIINGVSYVQAGTSVKEEHAVPGRSGLAAGLGEIPGAKPSLHH